VAVLGWTACVRISARTETRLFTTVSEEQEADFWSARFSMHGALPPVSSHYFSAINSEIMKRD